MDAIGNGFGQAALPRHRDAGEERRQDREDADVARRRSTQRQGDQQAESSVGCGLPSMYP